MNAQLSRQGRAVRLRAAYTPAEVVIAVAVVTVLFVSLHVGLSFGFAMTESNREDLRAAQITLERMEGIRLFTFDQLDSMDKTPRAFTKCNYTITASETARRTTIAGCKSESHAG